MKIAKIEGNIRWRCAEVEGGNWVAVCDPLKLTIQAATWADLMDEIGETLNIIFKDLVKSNELSRFLEDKGWRLIGPVPQEDDTVFDIPFLPSLSNRDREIGLSE